MKTNAAFTLIELLAVIVILAIIALIASPIIIGLIDDSRKESFKDGGYGIISAAETGFAKTLLSQTKAEETKYTYTNGVENKEYGNIELIYNGKKPYNGTIIIYVDGKTSIAFYENGYCASKSFDDNEITLEETSEEECIIASAGEEVNPNLYNYGENANLWVEGYSEAYDYGSYTYSKESDHLYMDAFHLSTATWVTNTPINLTNFSKVMVEINLNSGSGTSSLFASTNKMEDGTTYVVSADEPYTSSGIVTIELDVSGLSGEYYIGIHSESSYEGNVPRNIYKVWLE